MSKDFILPDIGEGIVECEIVEWLVAEGDEVKEDQPVVEVMTDKAMVEIPAKDDGVVEKLYYQKGDIAKVLIKCLEDGRNPFIANGSKIRDQSRKWNEADKIIKRWKDLYQFVVVNFILNYEQEYDHKGFNQVNDPILILNAYVSIIGSYIVKDYLDERTNPT